VYEGHAPVPSPLKQRKARARPTAPEILLEGLTLEELAEAAADPLLGKAQRKAARAQLREEKRRLREEKVRPLKTTSNERNQIGTLSMV
jgi:hypothetical protein